MGVEVVKVKGVPREVTYLPQEATSGEVGRVQGLDAAQTDIADIAHFAILVFEAKA